MRAISHDGQIQVAHEQQPELDPFDGGRQAWYLPEAGEIKLLEMRDIPVPSTDWRCDTGVREVDPSTCAPYVRA